jgi:CDP-paratose 2-epimerase
LATAVVTGAGGLVGSEATRFLARSGYAVVGIENDMRARFFGTEASTKTQVQRLQTAYPDVRILEADVRDADAINLLFREVGEQLELVVHTAAQPSHDWAATDPITDFTVNANGTLTLLEAMRRHASAATFVFTSTNKVYGDHPNSLPLLELETRLELPETHEYYGGISTSMPIDRSLHSLFGVSKTSADLLVQEYGNYFGLRTVCFRCGCISGPNHAGAQQHGFLSYLMRCAVTRTEYTIFGYGGKQVRDTIHSRDLVRAIASFHAAPRSGAVYNIGGGRASSCSVLEAIALCERIVGRDVRHAFVDEPRRGDHRWWITDLDEFTEDYPSWTITYDVETILREIYEQNVENWTAPHDR